MSSDKKKVFDNKGITVFKKKAVLLKFQGEVAQLRFKYKVPPYGFQSLSDVDAWDQKRNDELFEFLFDEGDGKRIFDGYDDDVLGLLGRYDLPTTLFSLLTNYIASNKIESSDLPFYACAIDIDDGPFQRVNEEQWKKHGKRFVKLLISEDAEESDVIKYVRAHWKSIRAHMGAFHKKNEKIKLNPEWDRNELIYALSRRSKRDLERELESRDFKYIGGEKTTKENIIGRLLVYYGYKAMGHDAVKKALERHMSKKKSDN